MNINNSRPVSKEGSRQTRTSDFEISRTLDEGNFKNVSESSKAKRLSSIHSQGPRDIKRNANFYLRSVLNEKVLESLRWEEENKDLFLENKAPKRKEKRLYESNFESSKKRKKIESVEMFPFSEENIKEEGFQKNRLLVGEADLSFAVALIEKHPEIAAFVTATTYEDEETLDNLYPETLPINKKILLERNVEVLHEVDATTLDEDPRFVNRKYGHIHFNFPHDGKAFKGDYPTQTPTIVGNFLASARDLLTDNGHVHMALVSKGETQTGGSNLGFYHGIVYKIADGALDNGYKLYKKRKFDTERYEGYAHKMTTNNRSTGVTEKNGREYIFEKINSDDEYEINENKKRFIVRPMEGNKRYLPEIETDNESSDYEV